MKKAITRIGITLVICIAILASAVLFPTFLYANKTEYSQVTIYHQKELHSNLTKVIDEALSRVKQSELYDPLFRPNLCLDDGSLYPRLIQKIKGSAFAYGVAHNAVFACEINVDQNYAIWNNRKKYLHEAFAHEFIHTFQWNKYGLGTLRIPFWKLEGYCEYIMTRDSDFANLKKNVNTLLEAERKGMTDWDWIEYENDFGTTPIYLRSQVYVQYLLEIEKWSYDDIIKHPILEQEAREKMLHWYNRNIDQ